MSHRLLSRDPGLDVWGLVLVVLVLVAVGVPGWPAIAVTAVGVATIAAVRGLAWWVCR